MTIALDAEQRLREATLNDERIGVPFVMGNLGGNQSGRIWGELSQDEATEITEITEDAMKSRKSGERKIGSFSPVLCGLWCARLSLADLFN